MANENLKNAVDTFNAALDARDTANAALKGATRRLNAAIKADPAGAAELGVEAIVRKAREPKDAPATPPATEAAKSGTRK